MRMLEELAWVGVNGFGPSRADDFSLLVIRTLASSFTKDVVLVTQ